MIVPRHWAEARIQHREGQRSITVRRFGWSDESYAAAELHARGRAGEALDAILSGTPLPRRERLAAYGEGLPIREEIVAQEGSLVLTRNSYGALCLNTPNVLFADVDFAHLPRRGLGVGWGLLMLVSVMLLGTFHPSVRRGDTGDGGDLVIEQSGEVLAPSPVLSRRHTRTAGPAAYR
ncbi:hypothetical protein [Xanthomonas pisi]|uniref:hypothetical protein n=1 Tax=Xanthomonas pisi TaxID=56457 RepID=UPI000AE5ED2D|nr:hypothetical protein [Xanthomonas pisi]